MTTSTYTVQGMTCGHCVASVTEEVTSIPGVTDVQVDLATGRVEITSQATLEPGVVRDAISEAGYEVLGSVS